MDTREYYNNKYHLQKTYKGDPHVFGEMLLYQIGRMFCSDQTVVPRHTQINCLELTIVTDGRGTVSTGEVATAVSAGDIYASFPGDIHEIRSDSVFPLKFDFIAINTTTPELKAEFERIITDFHAPDKRVIRDDKISELVSRATAEEGSQLLHSTRLLSSLLEEIFIYTVRAFHAMKLPKRIIDPADTELFCYELMSYIDSHLYTMKSLAELSEYTNYNYNYLSNLFKAVTDETLLGYYRRKRFELARQLLEDRTNSVTRVAAMLNYSSVYTFSRAYKGYFGISPTKYADSVAKGLADHILK